MKIGLRKPSVKKSIKARTTGKVKRKVKTRYIKRQLLVFGSCLNGNTKAPLKNRGAFA